jgi:hypothetical protein
MFEHACKLGCEGSVSERRGSIYSVEQLAQGEKPGRALPHEGRSRALALDDQVVGTAARP